MIEFYRTARGRAAIERAASRPTAFAAALDTALASAALCATPDAALDSFVAALDSPEEIALDCTHEP